VLGKITADGVFLEQLETNPSVYLPEITDQSLGGEVIQVTCFLMNFFKLF